MILNLIQCLLKAFTVASSDTFADGDTLTKWKLNDCQFRQIQWPYHKQSVIISSENINVASSEKLYRVHVVNQLLPPSLACFQCKITCDRSDFCSSRSDFLVVPQPAITCSKLTI